VEHRARQGRGGDRHLRSCSSSRRRARVRWWAPSPLAAAAAAWRGRGRVPIAGWSYGGVGQIGGEEEGGGVRSGPGEARTILLLHIISVWPSYGTYLPQGIYGARLLFFVSARTNKRHHHQDHVQCCRRRCCLYASQATLPRGIYKNKQDL